MQRALDGTKDILGWLELKGEKRKKRFSRARGMTRGGRIPGQCYVVAKRNGENP